MLCKVLLYEHIYRERFLLENGAHPTDALIMVFSGSFSVNFNGQETTISAGEIAFFPAGVNFKRNIIQPINALYAQIECSDKIKLSKGKVCLRDKQRLYSTLEAIKSTTNDNYLDGLIEHFISDIVYQYAYEQAKTILSDSRVLKAIDMIKNDRDKSIRIDSIAQALNITNATLIEIFKKELGLTPKEYLTATRINYAKQLLLNTDLTVGEIAYKCGYENIYYFSNAFKTITNISPSRYRIENKI